MEVIIIINHAQFQPSSPTYGIDALPPSLRTVDPDSHPYTVNTPRPSAVGGAMKRAMQSAAANAPLIKKPKEMVSLESYYYATLAGDSGVLDGEFKADMAFKCHLCKKVYMNNIEFARHLSLHVESDRASAVDLVDLCQCKYCFKVCSYLL